MPGLDAHHVRAMLGAGSVRREIEAGKAEDEADKLLPVERADDQPPVVDGGDEHMCGHDIGLAVGPDDALQVFDQGHVFGGFEQFDERIRHGSRQMRTASREFNVESGAPPESFGREVCVRDNSGGRQNGPA